ncbi:hypothetical protein [Thermophagus xiamenensis]|uniref:T9SS C-terminal target domain-containing protein n=1 Tax=Thermophagus xiamenensis TaxID=385682 RepID=A0A1I1WJ48_9BACT|nr:hypothetical protein [Thermophagus xiamenensis]SFD93110.1 hypothetical protein SAMN05444380_10454 [Thermophagus xiamenensis]
MKNYPFIYKLLICSITGILIFGCRDSEYLLPNDYTTIYDTGNGTGTVTWTADKEYLLDGIVFVNEGQILTIEPGTVIRAEPGQGENASALVVARGGKIRAEGTPEKPIIFTVKGDDLKGAVPIENNGLWGGVIILGNAPVNAPSGEALIEGLPIEDSRALYGGSIEDDNSGILRYVSIRHAGTKLDDGNEINGLTLGGVGSGTTIEYVEVISNRDDGFEFFGGTVNVRYLLAAFCGDDAFDFDLGYRGNCQYIVGLQAGSTGDLLIEVSDRYGYPQTKPYISHATLIGRGMDENDTIAKFGNGSAGTLVNSIILHQTAGIFIEYSDHNLDSYQQFTDGHINILNNVFYMVGKNLDEQILGVYSNLTNYSAQDSLVAASFNSGNNQLKDPAIIYNPQNIDVMNLLPENSQLGDVFLLEHEWFENPNFKGAFGNSNNWLNSWSILYTDGLFGENFQ